METDNTERDWYRGLRIVEEVLSGIGAGIVSVYAGPEAAKAVHGVTRQLWDEVDRSIDGAVGIVYTGPIRDGEVASAEYVASRGVTGWRWSPSVAAQLVGRVPGSGTWVRMAGGGAAQLAVLPPPEAGVLRGMPGSTVESIQYDRVANRWATR